MTKQNIVDIIISTSAGLATGHVMSENLGAPQIETILMQVNPNQSFILELVKILAPVVSSIITTLYLNKKHRKTNKKDESKF